MRIIGGMWKSRRIERPLSGTTRPVPDRVKESIFNMLGHHYGCVGSLPSVRVADVFAGGGSMGLEALSRGAAHCFFFERDRIALRALKGNLVSLNAETLATIVSHDAWKDVADFSRENPFGLILLDPPYASARDASPAGTIWRFLDRMGPCVQSGCLVVLHHPRPVDFSHVSSGWWRVMDRRTMGSNGLTVFEK